MRKNIVHYVTRQYMKQNRKRTFTTFLGIVCMVLLLTCVFVGKNTGLAFLEYVASLKDGKWHVNFYGTNEAGLETLQKLDYVSETAISSNYGNSEFSVSGNAQRPYLTVKAYTENNFDWMNVELKEGRFPENGQELVLCEQALADGAQIEIGDTVTAEFFQRSITGTEKGTETVFPLLRLKVAYGQTVEVPQNFPYFGENESFRENRDYTGETETYTVVGIIARPGFESLDAAGYTAITALEPSKIKAADTFNVSVRFALDRLPELYGATLRELIPCEDIEFNEYLLAMSQSAQDITMNLVITFLMVFFTLLIMLASVVLIYNVFNISYRERSRYLGMLSSVGATARQKRSSIYYEAFVLLIPALFVGILLGFLAIKAGILAIRPLLSQFMGYGEYVKDAPVALQVTVRELLLTVAVSAATVFLSAYLPARKIGKLGAIASIRGNVPDRKERRFTTKLPKGNRYLGERLLAGSLLRRQKKKTRSVTAAAATFLVILFVTSYGAAAFKGIAEARTKDMDFRLTTDQWNYSAMMSGYEPDEKSYEALKQEILKHPSVSDTAQWYSGMFAGEVDSAVMSRQYEEAYREILELYYGRPLSDAEFDELYRHKLPICLVGVDDETLQVLADRAGADYQLLKEKPSALVMQEGALSTRKVSVEGYEVNGFRNFYIDVMTDLKIGDCFDAFFWSPEGEKTETLSMEIAGFVNREILNGYMEISSQFLWLVVSQDTAETIFDLSNGRGLLDHDFYFQCDETDSEFVERLKSMNSADGSIFVTEMDANIRFLDAFTGIMDVLSICFMAVVSGICFLNLFNSIRGRMEERRGEFAVLRSIGMTGRQIQRMLFLENVRILGKSLIYGFAVSAVLNALLERGITSRFGSLVLELPWKMAVSGAALMILLIFFLTARCFGKEKDGNLLDHIRAKSL